MPAFGLEHLTSNVYIAYPFEENASGLTRDAYAHGSNATVPLDFLIDAAITLPQGNDRLYLYSITKLGPVGAYFNRFRFTNQAGTVVFVYDLPVFELAGTYQVVDMVSIAARIHVRLLVGATFVKYLSEIAFNTVDTFGARLPFDPYVITYVSARVQQFELEDPAIVVTGHVKFQGGYNTVIEQVDTGTQDDPTIQITVEPGTGAGLNPCEDLGKQPPALGLIADSNGNVNIEGDECTAIVPHKAAGILEVQSNCVQCCTCDDYVNGALLLKSLIQRADLLRKNLLAFHSQLTAAINAYNAKIATESELVMGVSGALGIGDAKRVGNIAVYVGNRSEKYPMDLTSITITSPGAVEATNFSPRTLPPLSGGSFYFVCRAGAPHSSWNVTATLTYTYNGSTKSESRSIVIT